MFIQKRSGLISRFYLFISLIQAEKFIDSFKFFDVFFKKKSGWPDQVYVGCIVLNELIVQVVLMMSTLFFGFYKPCFQQNLNMVADGGLCEVDYVLNFGTLTTSSLFGDVMQDLQAIRVSQRLGDLFNLL